MSTTPKSLFLPLSLMALAWLLAACGLLATPERPIALMPSPTSPPTLTPTSTQEPPPTATPMPDPVTVWVSPALPGSLRSLLDARVEASAGQIEYVPHAGLAKVRVVAAGQVPLSTWVYALVARFATVSDGVGFETLQSRWGGSQGSISMPTDVGAFMQWRIGLPAGLDVIEDDLAVIMDRTWETEGALGIVPFEALDPRWKVLAVDGVSPLQEGFDPESYRLAVSYGLSGDPEGIELVRSELAWPAGNRDPEKMTFLVMTGVTALTRATAWRMETAGILYPGEKIGDWLRLADLAHISQETAFTEDCPEPDPITKSMRFCSHPSYLALLEDLGVDLIELTGNHITDYGEEVLSQTLELYRERGFQYFGGGDNLDQARQPLLIEHHGNRLAFWGCNVAGPTRALATEDEPGAMPCDMEYVLPEVARLRSEGYLPVFTFQWFESYLETPIAGQVEAFRSAIEAGAVIVSGSQAHRPQSMEFYQGGFIHYGLGNLFFDQMFNDDVRKEFIDRYLFYEGRLHSIELRTAMLEDWSQPRPMSSVERSAFLEEMFAASGW